MTALSCTDGYFQSVNSIVVKCNLESREFVFQIAIKTLNNIEGVRVNSFGRSLAVEALTTYITCCVSFTCYSKQRCNYGELVITRCYIHDMPVTLLHACNSTQILKGLVT